MNFVYYIPTKIYFGPGSLANLASISFPGEKALIVVSKGGSMARLGILDRVKGYLKSAGVSVDVFQGISPNPNLEEITKGALVARQGYCDFVIGLGGGSSIDAAKSIAVMAANEGNYWDYVDGATGKGLPLAKKPLPVIAITTTAGTGSEADPWTVVTKEDTKEKVGFGTEDTFPLISIVDPELMLTVPPHLTAYQGFDTLFHSVEGYIANNANAASDMFALKSIELIAKYLPIAVNNGSDLEARGYVALANTLGGFVESLSGCTSEHSIEHALSAYHTALPHGAGLIMISLEYHKIFCPALAQRYSDMARAMGGTGEDAGEFLDRLSLLMTQCKVDNLKMSDYGIKKEDMPVYAQNAIDAMGGLFKKDRVKLSVEDVRGILERSYK
ncbi:MAG: iron-containing alcohol dehydrogenase [Christensenellales bacterium]|jgi:alcohol dehydrogenase